MAAIAARVEFGVSLADAAHSEGAAPDTVKGWLRRGRREGTGHYGDFAAAVEKARERAPDRSAPMDEDELRAVASEAARAGSVRALRLVWKMLRAERQGDSAPLNKLDKLAPLRERSRGQR